MATYQLNKSGAQIEKALDDATKVVANPSTTATTDLTKLTVGNTTYNISGGGQSSNYAGEMTFDEESGEYQMSLETFENAVSILENGSLPFVEAMGRPIYMTDADLETNSLTFSDTYSDINDGTILLYNFIAEKNSTTNEITIEMLTKENYSYQSPKRLFLGWINNNYIFNGTVDDLSDSENNQLYMDNLGNPYVGHKLYKTYHRSNSSTYSGIFEDSNGSQYLLKAKITYENDNFTINVEQYLIYNNQPK